MTSPSEFALVHWSDTPYRGRMTEYVPEGGRDRFDAPVQTRCAHCRKPGARTIDWGFECWVCGPDCFEAMWEGYNEACRVAEEEMKRWPEQPDDPFADLDASTPPAAPTGAAPGVSGTDYTLTGDDF